MNSFGEKEAWAYPGTTQIFWVPPIISGTGKATDFKFGQYIQRVHPNKSPIKILEKSERGCIQGLPKFFSGTPYYPRNGKSYGFQIWPVHSEVHPNKSPLNILEKSERGRIQGLPIFSGTPIIPGTGKATDFKFGQYIQRSIRTKAH